MLFKGSKAASFLRARKGGVAKDEGDNAFSVKLNLNAIAPVAPQALTVHACEFSRFIAFLST